MAFNEQKAVEAAYNVIKASGGSTTILRLVKLLYLIDREAINNWERSVTTDNHVSMPHGPVTSRIYDFHKQDIISPLWNNYISSNGRNIELRKELPPKKLSRREIELINSVVEKFKNTSTSALRTYTHKLPEYKETNSSIPIRFEDILDALGVDPKNVQRIKAEIESEEELKMLMGG